MTEIGITSVSRKGQVTIPKEIRDVMQLTEGAKVIFILDDGRIYLRKASAQKISQILEAQRRWKESSLAFQKRIRGEWR